MKKEFIALWMGSMLVVMSASCCFAETEEIVPKDNTTPTIEHVIRKYKRVSNANVGLSISKSGTASVKTSITGKNNETDKMIVTMSLQKYAGDKWSTVKTWKESTVSRDLTVKKQKNVSKGKYRVHATFYAYKGDSKERIVKNSAAVTY